MVQNNIFMDLALDLARRSALINEVPVGAVIILGNKVIASAHNEVYSRSDPTAHAEILVIQRAARYLSTSYLNECDLYVTLEPCPMCAHAISIARVRRLYFAASDLKSGGVESGPRLYSSTSRHHAPEVYGGIKEEESSLILREFFVTKRRTKS